jgi:hypothetical protein
MLSAKSSLISMNWPELTLSISLWGNGSAAGDSTRSAVAAGWGSCGRRELAEEGCVEVLAPDAVDCCREEVLIGAPAWAAAVSDTEVRRCGGGRVPRGAGEVKCAVEHVNEVVRPDVP